MKLISFSNDSETTDGISAQKPLSRLMEETDGTEIGYFADNLDDAAVEADTQPAPEVKISAKIEVGAEAIEAITPQAEEAFAEMGYRDFDETEAHNGVEAAFAEASKDDDLQNVAMPYYGAPNVEAGLLQVRPERTSLDEELQQVISSRLVAVLGVRREFMRQEATNEHTLTVTQHEVAGKPLSYEQGQLELAA